MTNDIFSNFEAIGVNDAFEVAIRSAEEQANHRAEVDNGKRSGYGSDNKWHEVNEATRETKYPENTDHIPVAGSPTGKVLYDDSVASKEYFRNQASANDYERRARANKGRGLGG